MAGLPGSGKTTIARELAGQTGGVVLSKDVIRAALFPPEDIEYSNEQDDFCMEVMLDTTEQSARIRTRDALFFSMAAPSPAGIRSTAFSIALRDSIKRGAFWSASVRTQPQRNACRHSWHRGSTSRPIATMRLYLQVKARFEEITLPKTVIDTDQPLHVCVSRALSALR